MVPVYETAVKLALASFEEKKGFQAEKMWSMVFQTAASRCLWTLQGFAEIYGE